MTKQNLPKKCKHKKSCYKCGKADGYVSHFGSENEIPEEECEWCKDIKNICPECFLEEDMTKQNKNWREKLYDIVGDNKSLYDKIEILIEEELQKFAEAVALNKIKKDWEDKDKIYATEYNFGKQTGYNQAVSELNNKINNYLKKYG